MMRDFLLGGLLVLATSASAQWSAFCTGNTNGFVVDFAVHDDTLFAAGLFTQVCSGNGPSVVKWNGNSWEDVGGGLPDGGHSLRVIDDVLHLARYEFQNTGNNVLRWNSGFWSGLGAAVTCSYFDGLAAHPSIYDVIGFNGEVVACGEFDAVGGDTTIHGIMRWTGTDWAPLGTGLSGSLPPYDIRYPHAMTVWNGDLVVAGNFTEAGGITCNGIARWDGAQWHAIGAGFNGAVYGVAEYQGMLYAGGDFSASDGTPMDRIARWNGSTWESPGFGFPGTSGEFVHSLVEVDGTLFIAGGFQEVTQNGSALSCGSILAWDGNSLDLLDGGTDGEVEAVIGWNGGVLIGGDFGQAGGVAAASLALWGGGNSMPETSSSPGLKLYPNPGHGPFTVEVDASDHLDLEVRDALGRLVERVMLDQGSATFGAGLAPGGYVLHGAGRARHFIVVDRARQQDL